MSYRYLFVVPPFFGHISPTLSVGKTLIEQGHDVAWTGIIPLDDKHIPQGGRYLFPHDKLVIHQEAIAQILRRQDDGPSLSGAETWKLALEETYIPFCRLMMPGVEEMIDTYQPDVVVSDCIAFAGGLSAYKKGIPYATTTPVPPDVAGQYAKAPKIMAWQTGLMYGLQKAVGVSASDLVIHSKKLNLVFTSSAFANVAEPEPHMRFVGPVSGRPNHTPFDWERLAAATGPKVFVSLGTLLEDIRGAYFDKLVTAFADTPLTIVAATDPGIRERWPDNFIVQRYVPQTALIPHMDAVICHGGFNTVNDALSNGLPILITPIAYDHFHTAKLIEDAGCGISVRYKRLRIPDLQNALGRLLSDEGYRRNARRIGQSFADAGGNHTAAQLLEDFAKGGMS